MEDTGLSKEISELLDRITKVKTPSSDILDTTLLTMVSSPTCVEWKGLCHAIKHTAQRLWKLKDETREIGGLKPLFAQKGFPAYPENDTESQKSEIIDSLFPMSVDDSNEARARSALWKFLDEITMDDTDALETWVLRDTRENDYRLLLLFDFLEFVQNLYEDESYATEGRETTGFPLLRSRLTSLLIREGTDDTTPHESLLSTIEKEIPATTADEV